MRSPETTERPVGVIENDFYDTIEANVQQIGVTYPDWSRQNPERVLLNTCYIGTTKGNAFSYTTGGAGVLDPKATSDAMYAYWEEQGYSLGKIIPLDEATGSLEIGATSSTGIRIGFRIGPNASQLLARSDCSLDSSLKNIPPVMPENRAQ